jgi:hypothetical protein
VSVAGVNSTVNDVLGNNTITLDGTANGTNRVTTGSGTDVITISGQGATTVTAGTGNDIVNTGKSNVTVVGAGSGVNIGANTAIASDGKDNVVVGLDSKTVIKGMSLSTGATNLVGRSAETNDQIKFVFTDTDLATKIDIQKFISWDVKFENKNVSVLNNTLSGDLVLYALVVGVTVPVKVSTVQVTWDNSSGLDLANYKLAAFTLEKQVLLGTLRRVFVSPAIRKF